MVFINRVFETDFGTPQFFYIYIYIYIYIIFNFLFVFIIISGELYYPF